MSSDPSKEKDHKPLSSLKRTGVPASADQPALTPPHGRVNGKQADKIETLSNPFWIETRESPVETNGTPAAEESLAPARDAEIIFETVNGNGDGDGKLSQKEIRRAKKAAKDLHLLTKDRWLVRNGHLLTFFGLYFFSILVLFRPYELIPGLGFLSTSAFYFAVATLALYIPTQLATEGNLTTLSTEVKAIIAMTALAVLTMPIAKDPGLSWEKFNDPYIKAVVIFIVLVNVVRTRRRLMHMMWLSFGIGIYLSYSAVDMYMNGKFMVEEYRVAVDVGGMFGNPNEMAMHFVMMTPLALVLGIAAKSKLIADIKGKALSEVGAIAADATDAIVKQLIDADVGKADIAAAVDTAMGK